MTVFFPYGTILGMHTSWESLDLPVTMLQFPLYAIILASFKRLRAQVVTLLVLLGAHTAAAVIGLTVFGR
jgi:hypothetical protein